MDSEVPAVSHLPVALDKACPFCKPQLHTLKNGTAVTLPHKAKNPHAWCQFRPHEVGR